MKNTILRILFACAVLCTLAFGQTASLMPVPRIQFLDTNAHPLAGGLVYTYIGGTSTPAPTYTDSTATILNTNPVVLDSGGFASIWLGPIAYKIVVKNALGGSQYTVDNVSNNIAAGSINSTAYLLNGVNLADVAWTWTGAQTFNGNTNFAGPVTFQAASGSFSGSVNGALNVLNYGAKCDGLTDDTTAFLAASTAAFTSTYPYGLVIPATGHSCIISQWNLTNHFGQQGGSPVGSIHIIGQSGEFGGQSTIQCKESSPNSGICIDLSGSDQVTIDGVRILGGTSAADAPKVVILTARTASDLGYSNGFYFRNLDLETNGQFNWYSYGGEEVKWENSRFVYNGAAGAGEANVFLSNINSRGITSPFQTMKSGDVSMTQVAFDDGTIMGCANLSGACIELDNAITNPFGGIDDVKIYGYANLGSDSARPFIKDLSTGELHSIKLENRVEAANSGDILLSFGSSSIKGLKVYSTFAMASVPSNPIVTFTNITGTVGEGSIIDVQPSDRQVNYPSTVVNCAMPANFIFGLIIYDRNKFGGGNTANSCTGADERNGAASGPFTDGAGNYTTPGYMQAGNKKWLAADFTDANSAALQAITGLSFALPASKQFSFHCALMYSQATNVAGDQFGVGVITTAPVNANVFGQAYTNTGAAAPESVGVLNALASTTPTAVVTFQPAVTGVLGASLDGTIETGAGASTFNLYILNGTAADVIVVKRGSYCEVY